MEGSMDGLMQLGVMGKISTGNNLLDVLLCLMLPAVLKYVTQKLNETLQDATKVPAAWDEFISWFKSRKRTSVRFIKHTKVTRSFWTDHGTEEGVHNNILQRAVLLYINSLQNTARRFDDAQLMLHAPPEETEGCRGGYDSERDDGDSDEVMDEASRLAAYKVIAGPPQGRWVVVQKLADGSVVEFMRSVHYGDESDEGSGGRSKPEKTETEFGIRASSTLHDPEGMVRSFVDSAYQYYLSQMARDKVDCRYFYQPYQATGSGEGESGDGGGNGSTGLCYKRYPLSGAKTFESGFFHPDKESILSLVDNFSAKTGKFSIPGFPHKLGLLLHGPPGTGKTSLIKSLAAYTNRHVVSVPLNKIRTNQELMDILFDRQYKVLGQHLPVKLPFSKTIFVMEDIDAACTVVQKRDSSACSPAAANTSSGTASPESILTAAELQIGPSPDKKMAAKWLDDTDQLNLAGLLNVLDGVLDCPERIVVMTTNHPEKLDPALIRPGRVNRKVYMGFLQAREANQMAEHYFGAVGPKCASTISSIVSQGNITPAAMEILCGEHDTVEQLCVGLAEMAGGQDHSPAALRPSQSALGGVKEASKILTAMARGQSAPVPEFVRPDLNGAAAAS